MGNTQSPLNFGAGPAKLPREVLKEVQDELLSFQGMGMSLMEMSHRSKEYMKINNDAQIVIKELLNIPSNYNVLFLQGGGCGAFAAIPLNLMNRTGSADYAVTGTWSAKAANEAAKYGEVNLVFPKAEKPGSIPPQSTWTMNPNASYLYYCENETVEGVEYPKIPTPPNGVPLVADMSSNIMTKQIDVSKFGLIFAGSQKNIGPAGVTVVIVREDLIGNAMKCCPLVFDFDHIAKQNSIHNTPATFSVYTMEKVLQWIKKNGGVKQMEENSAEKSKLLYQTIIDSEGFYRCTVDENFRSRINVPFRISNEDLEAKFLVEAENQNMFQLKGHRLVGGMRASLYNAVSLDDVKGLVKFMKEFQKRFN